MRIAQLDALRAVAVLLVILRHLREGQANHALNEAVLALSSAPHDLHHALALVAAAICRSGWMGVDLFFVLSGFLVSGLLFREYKARAQVRLSRFLIRRGFKIYPSFYVFLAGTVIATGLFTAREIKPAAIVCEALFVQNYGPSLWGHTWSLAIEEHFYLLLGGLLLWRSKRPGGFDVVPRLFVAVALTVLTLRLVTSLLVPTFDLKTHAFPTHLRLDELFYGVALSYYWNLHPERLEPLRARRGLLALGAWVCVAPALFLEGSSFFMRTVGVSLLSVGFSALLLWALWTPPSGSRLVRRAGALLAAMGFHSYSIYLWHLPVLVVGVPLVARLTGQSLGWPAELLLYLCGSVGVGVVMAKVIELPALRLRDRLFPDAAAPPERARV